MTKNDRYDEAHIRPAEGNGSLQAAYGMLEWKQDPMIGKDNLFLRSLLEESFAGWLKDCAALPSFRHVSVMLVHSSGELVGTSGSLATDKQRLELMRDAAADLLANRHSAQLVHREWNGCKAILSIIHGRSDQSPLAAFVFAAEHASVHFNEEAIQLSVLLWRNGYYRLLERHNMKRIIEEQEHIVREAERSDALNKAAKRLLDQIEVSSVLTEMLASLDGLYPNMKALLYLSQDYRHEDPRVKPLTFKNTAHDLVAKAFLEGKYAVEGQLDGSVELAVPMSGKQAIYGVLCASFAAGAWSEAILSDIMVFADSAGTAFENAKLYEQSNSLIDELRLINELTKRLNQSLRLKQIFHFVSTEMRRIFEADYCSVLQLDPVTKQFVVMSTNVPHVTSDHFLLEYGFCGIMYRTKEPLIISDYWETRVVNSKLMDNTGSRSLIAAPILVEDEVVGALLIMHSDPNYFSYDDYKLLQVICTHIALAVANASLHAEVRRMVITDHLTGLHTRHYLNEQIQKRQQKDRLGSLILLDIDFFKQVNDTFGHLTGDRILLQVSNIIKGAIRQDDIAARWGGEELAVYLPNIEQEQALRIAERIRMRVMEETEPEVTISCGVSEWTTEQEKVSVETLFHRADMALYEAKHNGKNCIVVYRE